MNHIGTLNRMSRSFAVQHAPGFLRVVDDAKSRTREITVAQTRERLQSNLKAALIDVREESEWVAGHAAGAHYLGKGVLERDIEAQYPDKKSELIMYCGGGFRSALACDTAQKMGYDNVWSLAGSYRALVAEKWDIVK